MERLEKIFNAWNMGRGMGESAEKQQRFVQSNELMRIRNLKFCKLGEKSGKDCGVAGVEAVPGRFQPRDEAFGIVESAWHGRPHVDQT